MAFENSTKKSGNFQPYVISSTPQLLIKYRSKALYFSAIDVFYLFAEELTMV